MQQIKSLYQDSRLYTFLGIVAFLYFHHCYGYFGHYGFDDIMGYGFYAKKWANGQLFYLNEDFFSYRWGFIGLTGLSYALFGMSDFSSAIVPSIVLLSTVLLVFFNLRQHQKSVAILGVLLLVLDSWTLYYSDKLMPDTMVALLVYLAFTIIAHCRYQSSGANDVKYAFLMAFVLIFAYISKQSVLLLFPVFFTLFLLDVLQKRMLKFWTYNVLFCIVFGLLYLLFIYYLTGDPFARFHAVEKGLDDNLGAGHSFSFCNYAIQPWSVLLYRIGFEMIHKFMATGMMLSMLFATATLFSFKLKHIIRQTTSGHYWSLVFILSFLSSNFMTTSYKAYLPICPDIRHFLFLVPIAVTVAAPFINQFAQNLKHKWSMGLVLAIITGLAYYSNVGNFLWVYMAVLALFVIRCLVPEHRLSYWGFLSMLIILASIPAFSSMQTARQNGYIEQRAVIYEYLKPIKTPSVVFTNVIQSHFGQYYMEFDSSAFVQFKSYDQIEGFDFGAVDSVYVLANGTTRYMSNFAYEELPACIRACYESRQDASILSIYHSQKVALYKLNNPLLLHQ